MPEHRLSILHISDLHARSLDVDELPEPARERRRSQVRREAASRARVLGTAWVDNLRALYPNGERPDLVCFTGDVADWGLAAEYAKATDLVDELVGVLGIARSQVYAVPGNHDVQRYTSEAEWAAMRELLRTDTRATTEWLAGGDPPRAVEAGVADAVMQRTAAFWRWVKDGLGRPELLPDRHPHRRLGYHHVPALPQLPFDVHVIGLDSAWLAGDDHDQGNLWLTERQRDMLLQDEHGQPWTGFRLALVHHPLEELAQPDIGPTRRGLARSADLLLHGHQHDPVGSSLVDLDGDALRVLAAGCLYEGTGGSELKNGCQRIDVVLDDVGRPLQAEIWFRAWSSRGHWYSDSSLYRGLTDGRMVWNAWGSGSGASSYEHRAISPESPNRHHGSGRVVGSSPVEMSGSEPASGDREILATRLRRAAARVYDKHDFASLGAGGPRRDVTLRQICVPIRLRSMASDAESRLIDLQELDVLLHGIPSCRLVILGDAGSGKSTLARHIASTLAREEGGTTPMLLTVRDWIAEGKREGLLEMAAREASTTLSVRTTADAIESLCDEGQALFIVDGIDEAAEPAVRRRLRDRLNGFAVSHAKVPIVVTSRIAGYHDLTLDESFVELRLEPFDDAAIEDFVHRWYDVVEIDPAKRLHNRVALLRALEVEPRAKALARNPLLATLIAMVHPSEGQLPVGRAKLYGMLIKLLLVTWPAERGSELEELHGTQQQPMLEKLALRLQEQRGGGPGVQDAEILVDLPIMDRMLAGLLSEALPEHNPHQSEQLAYRWRKWLIEGCGLLQEHRPRQVGFLHLSLMEYLAGRAMLEQNICDGHDAIARLVLGRHMLEAWRETLLLMVGSESEIQPLGRAIVDYLLRQTAGEAETLQWSACSFGLALLREDVDVGPTRERLLDATARALPESGNVVSPIEASSTLSDIIRFSQRHGEATRLWLKTSLEQAAPNELSNLLVLAEHAIPWKDTVGYLDSRSTRTETVSSLLAWKDAHRVKAWARSRSTLQSWAYWAHTSPLEEIFRRSLAELEQDSPKGIWIPQLMLRAGWIGRMLTASRPRLSSESELTAGPMAATGLYATVRTHNSFMPNRMSSIQWPNSRLGAARRYPMHILEVSFPITGDFGEVFSSGFISMFAEHFASFLAFDVARESPAIEWSAVAEQIAWEFAFELTGSVDFHESPIDTKVSYGQPPTAAPSLWSEIRDGLPRSKWEGVDPSLGMALEAYSAVVTLGDSAEPRHIEALATLRVQNRWLNLFLTPLVEYASRFRPLHDHPDLHALLLTYGLIQYQTTWEWPDCPYWSSWLASEPPEHWLPAHVWHLIRSVQDPTNNIHYERAETCLDRNDWPQLAEDLRNNILHDCRGVR